MKYRNFVQLCGEVVDDPKIHVFDSGSNVKRVTIKTVDSWKDKKTKEWNHFSSFHKVCLFNFESDVVKGDCLFVEGSLQTRKYLDDKTGKDTYITEVIVKNHLGSVYFIAQDSLSMEVSSPGDFGNNEAPF